MEMEMEIESEVVISEDNILVNGDSSLVILSRHGILKWTSPSCSTKVCIAHDALGLTADEPANSIVLHCFVKSEGILCLGLGNSTHGYKRNRKDFHFQVNNPQSFGSWRSCIQECFNTLERPKRLLVLLNPFGGKKIARKIFDDEVKPLFEVAQINFTIQETQFQRHAQEIAKSMDLSNFDGILCVSGDGILVEVINGLMERPDRELAIQMPLGLIPAGTGNGMVKSLLDDADEACNPANAAFAVIKGHRRSLDVLTVMQGQTCFYSGLMLTWGLIADIDIESEKYRWMGSSRIDFYTLIRVARLRRYSGAVYFIPAPGYEEYGKPVNMENSLAEQPQETKGSAFEHIRALANLQTNEWKCIEGNFVMVWALNVPWASEDIKPAPFAKFSDGFMDLILVKECSRLAMLNLVLKLANGTHVNSKHVQYLKVKAFSLVPGGRVGGFTQGGIIDVDGEVIAKGKGAFATNKVDVMSYGPAIQIKVNNGLATLFCPIAESSISHKE